MNWENLKHIANRYMYAQASDHEGVKEKRLRLDRQGTFYTRQNNNFVKITLFFYIEDL